MKTILTAFTMGFLMIGCSRNAYRDVTFTKEKKVNFETFKTFAWLPDKDSADRGSIYAIMRNNTVNYFTHCFAELGYKAEMEEPDLLLELTVKSDRKEIDNPLVPKPYSTTSVTIYYNPYLHPLSNPFKYNKPFTYNYFNYPTGKEPRPETYQKNVIVLNVIDRRQQKIIWSSTASANLYDRAYLSQNLHPVVYKMLKGYPVKPLNRHKSSTKK